MSQNEHLNVCEQKINCIMYSTVYLLLVTLIEIITIIII